MFVLSCGSAIRELRPVFIKGNLELQARICNRLCSIVRMKMLESEAESRLRERNNDAK